MGDKKKIRYGSPDPLAKYEEAAGITSPAPAPVTSVPRRTTQPFIPKEGKLYPLTRIMDDEALLNRALRGSKTYTDSELKQGYRKMGPGLKKGGDCPKCKK